MYIICIRQGGLHPLQQNTLCIIIINWVEAQRGFISIDTEYLCVIYCLKSYSIIYLFIISYKTNNEESL